MNNFQSLIEKKISNKNFDLLESYESLAYVFAKELHIPPSELMDMPIPLVISLAENYHKDMKNQQKAIKKQRKR